VFTTAGLAAIGGLITIVKFILAQFSAEAKLRRLELWLERKRTAMAVEAERLEATNNRIDREPDKTGQELVDKLNEQFKGDHDAPKP
jgi:hypothetical protein